MRNKIFNFGIPIFLLGIITIILIYFTAVLLNSLNLPLTSYLLNITIVLSTILLTYWLLTKKRFDFYKLFVFYLGLIVGIWSTDITLQNTQFKYFVGLYTAIFILKTIISFLQYILHRIRKDIKFEKNKISWGIDINLINKAENNNSLSLPLDSFEKINKIRQNMNDKNLFTALEGILDKLKNTVLNKNNIKFNRIFCIDGNWGSGKSTLIQLLKESLSKFNNKADSKYKEPVWLDFNPWLYNNQDELIKDFFSDFKQKSYENWGIDLEPEISSITKAITPSFEGWGLKIPFLDLLPKVFNSDKTSDKDKASLNKKLKNIDRPFIIVLDDVDRPCEIAEIILIVKLISVLSNLKNITVVTAFDYKRVSQLISKQTEDVGQKFLEKFINKTYKIPVCEYKELEAIFISNLIESGKLTTSNINFAKPVFQEFVWAANRQWFRASESNSSKSENIVLNPLYERYKSVYIELNPGGNYAKDYEVTIYPILTTAISDLINGNTSNIDSLVRSFVKPIQKIKRVALWNDHSSELKDGLSQFGIPASEEIYNTINSFLSDRDDLYGQYLHDQIVVQFTQLEQRYPQIVDNDHKATYESFRNNFLVRVQDYINRFEDLKDNDYTMVISWLIEPMTPRDVIKFVSNVSEELSDWDNKDIIERIIETSVKDIYQYSL